MRGGLVWRAVGFLVALLTVAHAVLATVPGAICFWPGYCLTSWGYGLNKYGWTYRGPSTGVLTAPFNYNVYIVWGDDSVTPFTATQKQIVVELFQHLGSSAWFQNLTAEWPQNNDLGSNQTSTISITNCLSGAPAHCWSVTTHAGDAANTNLACATAQSHGITDPYGIFVTIYSQPNIVGNIGTNAPCSFGGHALYALQDYITGVSPGCMSVLDADVTPITTTSGNFTQPAGTVGVGFTAALNAHNIFIPVGGYYTNLSALGCFFCTLQPFPNATFANAAPGTVISGGSNVYQFLFPPTPNAANGGCYFDQEIWIMTEELAGSLGNFHGEGWASNTIGELHEPCLNGGSFDSTFNSPSGVTIPSNFGFVDVATRYDYLLGPWFHITQGAYCGSQNYSTYWNIPCKRNADCPATSGGCSGTLPGSHCIAPSCSDGIKNGFETDVDCGGICGRCTTSQHCGSLFDCIGGTPPLLCISGLCAYQ